MLKRVGDISSGAVVALLAWPQNNSVYEKPCKLAVAPSSGGYPLGALGVCLVAVAVATIGLLRRRQATLPEIRSVTVRGDGARRKWH